MDVYGNLLQSHFSDLTNQPTKGAPVAGTTTPTPLTDAAISVVEYIGEQVPALFARSLETQITLAHEKIAVQEKEIAEARKSRDDFALHEAEALASRDTARASLAAVTAKMEAIRKKCQNIVDFGDGLIVASTVLSIITQEEGKPTL